MAATVFQRYLLRAATNNVAITQGATSSLFVQTASVPLGGVWTIRWRWINGGVSCADNAAKITVIAMTPAWQLYDINGNTLYSLIGVPDSVFTPSPTFPALVGVNFAMGFDAHQTVSSLDQLGGVAVTTNAVVALWVTNTDGAAAHSVSISLNAIIEFESSGSSDA